MSYLLPTTSISVPKLKNFNGLRRTTEGMLYLTFYDKEKVNDEITVSKYFEEGKSEFVPVDETNYTTERKEYLDNPQLFTGDGNTKVFNLSISGLTISQISVFVNSIEKTAFTDYTLSGTTLTLLIAPGNGISVAVFQNKKRYFNNDSDKYQQFTYDFKSTYYINNDGILVKRENKPVARTPLPSDNFDSFESTSVVNNTTWSI
jgi:hypothetical protein